MKTTLKLKINPIREFLRLSIHQIKPSKGLFFLIKSRETVPLSKWHDRSYVALRQTIHLLITNKSNFLKIIARKNLRKRSNYVFIKPESEDFPRLKIRECDRLYYGGK
jgi:hypothetical protein